MGRNVYVAEGKKWFLSLSHYDRLESLLSFRDVDIPAHEVHEVGAL